MPAYGTNNPPYSITFNPPLNQYVIHAAEAVVTGELSERFQMPLNPQGPARGLRIEIDFSAAPGNCEVQVMESDDDLLGALGYNQVAAGGDQTQANLVAGPNGAGTRLIFELIPFAGQFSALFWKTAPANNVTVTARATRAS
jgi:hypothetical protein